MTTSKRNNMDFPRSLVTLIFLILLFSADRNVSVAQEISIFSFIHDLIQYNVAGIPLIHEQTQWDFNPEDGKQRRIRYEKENGRHGEIAIEKIGMGVGNKEPLRRTA
ncbi:hypothetical protein WN51_02594 [Melipona quadrifasciata]|uniref:Uncharacterized protein n=1 Tax=Melipona quadrifasciata TaxID=166423 RepID=A0A0N0BDK0_9HYME|nr:hypothetical protein WN51_02594 [Melipona quadrifasciata]